MSYLRYYIYFWANHFSLWPTPNLAAHPFIFHKELFFLVGREIKYCVKTKWFYYACQNHCNYYLSDKISLWFYFLAAWYSGADRYDLPTAFSVNPVHASLTAVYVSNVCWYTNIFVNLKFLIDSINGFHVWKYAFLGFILLLKIKLFHI